MITYLIHTHPRVEGVLLSKEGRWGNVPFPTREAATAAAEADAKGDAFRIIPG